MNKSIVMAVLSAAGIAASALGQNGQQTPTGNPAGYVFEFRIVADSDAGAPSGVWTNHGLSNTATQIGFWLQARVAQTVNQNWGIVRVTPPAVPETSTISVSDSAGSSMQRAHSGNVGANPRYGRGAGYRNGGSNTGPTGNSGTSQPFPSAVGNENGGIDSGGARIYNFDAFVGGQRTGDGDPDNNPWGINGGAQSAPHPSDGTFSPWASVYHFDLFPTNVLTQRTITITAFAQIQGARAVEATDDSFVNWAMRVGPGRNMFAEYSFQYGIPTPGAAALMGLGMLAGARRRR